MTVGDLDKVFKNVAVDLRENKSTSFEYLDTRWVRTGLSSLIAVTFIHGIQMECLERRISFQWKLIWNIISHQLRTLELTIQTITKFQNMQGSLCVSFLIFISFTMIFDANFASTSALVSARQVVSELVYSQFINTDEGIPAPCQQWCHLSSDEARVTRSCKLYFKLL